MTPEQIEIERKAFAEWATEKAFLPTSYVMWLTWLAPFCPCDSKTMRKAVRWAERAHGIGVIRAALASAPHPPSNTLGDALTGPGDPVASLPSIPDATC